MPKDRIQKFHSAKKDQDENKKIFEYPLCHHLLTQLFTNNRLLKVIHIFKSYLVDICSL